MMTKLHSSFFTLAFFHLLSICQCDIRYMQIYEGQDVTLPCKYDSKYHGKCAICWTRGNIPLRGCGEDLITTDGDKVLKRKSIRFRMTGDLPKGDVSLTILSTTKQDTGKYGCRIHIPGLFNDEMNYVHLTVQNALIPTTLETTSMSSTRGIVTTAITKASAPTTQEPVVTTFSEHKAPESQTSQNPGGTDNAQNSSFASSSVAPEISTVDSPTQPLWSSNPTYDNAIDYHGSTSVEKRERVNISAVIVPLFLLLVALTSLLVLLRWKRMKKRDTVDIAQSSDNSVIYSNTGSTVGLYNREMAVENVYQIQAENEYEQWH